VLQLRPNLTPQARYEAVAHLTGKHELVPFVIADNQSVQRVVWGIAADHELLSLVGTRRELLSDIAADLKKRTPLIGLSNTLDTTPAQLIPLVKEFGFKGIIAKRKDHVTRSASDPALG
jgi:hypothetical protein